MITSKNGKIKNRIKRYLKIKFKQYLQICAEIRRKEDGIGKLKEEIKNREDNLSYNRLLQAKLEAELEAALG